MRNLVIKFKYFINTLLLFVSLAGVLFSQHANADQGVKLKKALEASYEYNEELRILRENYMDAIEQFPAALSGFMPKVSARFSHTDQETKREIGTQGPTNSNFQRSIVLEQPLFNGGRSVNNLRAAQSAIRAARDKYYADEQDVIFRLIQLYLNCVEAEEKYDISKISVKANQTQLEATREKFRLGESTETDVASAESGLANATANEALAYANMQTLQASFMRSFGLRPEGLKMPEVPQDIPQDLRVLTERAKVANLNILSSKNQTKAARASELAAKGALLPSLSFQITGARSKLNPDNTDRGTTDNRSITSTLSLDVPILSRGGAEYSDIRRARIQTRRQKLNLDAQVKQVQSQSKAFYEQLMASRKRVEATNTAVSAAEVAYAGIVQEEKLGSKTIVDVLNFEDRLNKARERRVEAKKELVQNAYNLKLLIGELTMQSLKIPVNYFDPELEFKRVKLKIIGFK